MDTPTWTYAADLDPAALARALDGVTRGPEGTGCVVLLTEGDVAAVPTLQAWAQQRGRRLFGGVVPGLVIEGRFERKGALLLALHPEVPVALVPLPPEAGRTADRGLVELAEFAAQHANPAGGDTLFLLLDATIADIGSMIDRLYAQTGDALNYAGSCVGSETFRRVPCVFDAQRFLDQAVIAAVLPRHPGPVLAHHYSGGAADWVASAAEGNRVERIDGRPAFDVYRELMAREFGIDLSKENFYQYAVHFPFAVNRARGEPLVRIPIQVGDDGAVICFGEVRANALLGVVRAVEPGDPGTAQAVAAAGGAGPHPAILAFYCAGRLLHLQEGAALKELAALSAAVAPKAVFGALSLGEIGSAQAIYPAFHNATIVALPWS